MFMTLYGYQRWAVMWGNKSIELSGLHIRWFITWHMCHRGHWFNMLMDNLTVGGRTEMVWHPILKKPSICTQLSVHSHTARSLSVIHTMLWLWPYYMSWAHSITTPCTCVNNTSWNQQKVVLEFPTGKERQLEVGDTWAVGSILHRYRGC